MIPPWPFREQHAVEGGINRRYDYCQSNQTPLVRINDPVQVHRPVCPCSPRCNQLTHRFTHVLDTDPTDYGRHR